MGKGNATEFDPPADRKLEYTRSHRSQAHARTGKVSALWAARTASASAGAGTPDPLSSRPHGRTAAAVCLRRGQESPENVTGTRRCVFKNTTCWRIKYLKENIAGGT